MAGDAIPYKGFVWLSALFRSMYLRLDCGPEDHRSCYSQGHNGKNALGLPSEAGSITVEYHRRGVYVNAVILSHLSCIYSPETVDTVGAALERLKCGCLMRRSMRKAGKRGCCLADFFSQATSPSDLQVRLSS